MKLFFRSVRASIIVAVLAALSLGTARSAAAHAVVYPKKAAPKGFERYSLRVPNEKDVPTTRVEIRFPKGLRVTSFEEVNGWTLEVLTDSAKAIIGAVWTGSLAPHRFIEFPFVAANPKTNTKLVWPAYQTYASGERVDWVGAEGSKHPASSTSIESLEPSRWSPAMLMSGAALLISLLTFGLALRPASDRETPGPEPM